MDVGVDGVDVVVDVGVDVVDVVVVVVVEVRVVVCVGEKISMAIGQRGDSIAGFALQRRRVSVPCFGPCATDR